MSANHQIIHPTFLPAGILVIKESSSHYESSKVLNYCGRIRRLHCSTLTNSSFAAALPPPSVIADTVTTNSISLSFSFNSHYEVGASVRLPPLAHLVPA